MSNRDRRSALLIAFPPRDGNHRQTTALRETYCIITFEKSVRQKEASGKIDQTGVNGIWQYLLRGTNQIRARNLYFNQEKHR